MVDWTGIERPADRLHAFIGGFHATQYVYTGVETGLFEALREPRSPPALAADLDLHEPYVKGFCEVGLRWGLVETVGTPAPDPETGRLPATVRYRLVDAFVAPLADRDAVPYMGDVFRFAARYNGADYLRYPEYFETGEGHAYADRGDEFSGVIQGSSRGVQVIFVEKLLPEIATTATARLEAGGRVLDVGCGGGHLGCYLAEQYPAIEVVGVDLDGDALARARAAIMDHGLSDRVAVREQDAAGIDPAEEFDVVVSFLNVHEIPAGKRSAVFDRIGDVLADDGALVVFDEVYPDSAADFTEPPYTNGVESQWSELVWGNVIPTPTEHRSLLDAAGLRETARSAFADRFVVFEAVPA